MCDKTMGVPREGVACSGHIMTAGPVQSSTVALHVCQATQQISYFHASDIETSRCRLRRSFCPCEHTSIRISYLQHLKRVSAKIYLSRISRLASLPRRSVVQC